MATITEDYVSFETAKLLKDKGFNEPTAGTYYKDGTFEYLSLNRWNSKFITPISAPTLQMAMKWLREKHLLHTSIDMVNGGRWEYEIDDISNPFDGGILPKYYCSEFFCSYEDACEAGIKHCLENLI